MENSTCRNAQIDILRSVAMLMIICGHFCIHGLNHVAIPNATSVSFTESTQGIINFSILQFMEYASIIGTNLFFMITGYFLVKPRTIAYAISKSAKTWKVVMLYSVGIYIVLSLTGAIDSSFNQFISQLFPIHSHNYWFMSNYIVLILLSPFTSRLLYSLSQREYQVLLLVLLFINFGERNIGYGNMFSGNMSLVFDVALFAWGGYLKRFPFKEFRADYLVYFALYIAACIALTATAMRCKFLPTILPTQQFISAV